jgi:protein-S-isoprenylcysteine O-methyltransferase Ste14
MAMIDRLLRQRVNGVVSATFSSSLIVRPAREPTIEFCGGEPIAYRFQITPEERALADLFGVDFLAYQAKVRRWL